MAKATCSIDECENPSNTRGWCSAHYHRWQRYGDPLAGRRYQGEAERYFDLHVATVTDECLLWPFRTMAGGYGELIYQGKKWGAHALSCTRWHGPRPTGMHAAHGPCHNPLCFNGAHLSWKTHGDNQRDKFRDGTDARGVKHPRAKLTDADVIEIRRRDASGESSFAIAADYPVHAGTIRKITNRDSWRHI